MNIKSNFTYSLVNEKTGSKFRGRLAVTDRSVPQRMTGRDGNGVVCHLNLSDIEPDWVVVGVVADPVKRPSFDLRALFQSLDRGDK